MKVAEDRRDVVELSCSRHQPSSCVLGRLKILEQTATSTVQQAVTVIQAAADEGVYECLYRYIYVSILTVGEARSRIFWNNLFPRVSLIDKGL